MGSKQPFKRIDPDDPDDLMSILDSNRPGPKQLYDEFDPQAVLWSEFGIKPHLPLKNKVEQLLIGYRMSAGDIAALLNVDLDAVEIEMKNLNDEWAALGRMPSPEERERLRGRQIANLHKMIQDIDEGLGTITGDKSRLLSLKGSILNQLSTLQGLPVDKRELAPKEEEEYIDPVEESLANMSDEDKAKLFKELQGSDQQD